MSSDIGNLLRWLGERGADVGERIKKLAGPYVFESPILPDRKNEDWAVATDGRGLVWALDWRPTLIHPLWDNNKETREKLLKFLFPPAACRPAWTGRIDELRVWTGPGVRSLPCEACKGTSKDSEYVSCTFCENDGWMLPDVRPGKVCDLPLNLNLLACLLEPFPADAEVTLIPEPREDAGYKPGMLWIISPRFRIVQMGMVESKDPTDDLFGKWPTAPRFPVMEGASK